MKYAIGYSIEEFETDNGVRPYHQWLHGLATSVRARIQARIFRFEIGNLGDTKSVGSGVYEARHPATWW